MIKRIAAYINRWRKPKGLISYHDGRWLVEYIRFDGCGLVQGDTNIMIKAFTDEGVNTCIYVPNLDNIGKATIIQCEFKEDKTK